MGQNWLSDRLRRIVLTDILPELIVFITLRVQAMPAMGLVLSVPFVWWLCGRGRRLFRERRYIGVVGVIALAAGGSVVRGEDHAVEFYRAFNLNGPAVMIDDHSWEGGDAAGLMIQGNAFENQSVALKPTTDANRAKMIRSSRWGGSVEVAVTDVPTGVYQVLLYVWEDNNSERYSISVNGRQVLANFNSGTAGQWKRLGPWKTTVRDGRITVGAKGGAANLSGLEIWSGSGVVPDPLVAAFEDKPTEEQLAFFESRIRPLLVDHCYSCHSADAEEPDGGLLLDSRAGMAKGGHSGAAVIPGDPDNSPLISAVRHTNPDLKMPPEEKLSEDRIADLETWIRMKAPDPRTIDTVAIVKARNEIDWEKAREFWSLRPVADVQPPTVEQSDWPRNDIDRFLLAKMEAAGLAPSEDADRRTWIRRATYDLIGLPPSPQDIETFLQDESADAFLKVIDRLLSSPHYGERWGRHWMDVWRYSDWYGSRGINEIRYSQRHIWRWRDWIVQSLNKDKGYDQMILEMLAADEMAGADPAVLPATGFLGRNWYKFDRNVWLFETVERTGEAFLGMTLRCCRCHDHKFDPLTQEEYYRFRAFFEPHDVRTDPVSMLTGTKKDATLGEVLNDGIPLVYDKTLDAPTYRFERGDSRHPDESKTLTPGTPAALGGSVDVQPIELPAEMWYPALRPGLSDSLIQKAKNEVTAVEERVKEAEAKLSEAGQKLAAAPVSQDLTEEEVFLAEDFSESHPDVWEQVNGTWTYEDGKLVQSAVTSFATMVSKAKLVGDFRIRLRYRALEPGTYRSVGFSFDYIDKGNSQDVYTSTGDERQSVQAFHRFGGKQVYPQAGIVRTELIVGEEVELDVTVVGSRLTIDLNGERKLEYQMPEKRREGKFALWVHQGAAEFLDLKITKLAESRETLEEHQRSADHQLQIAKAELEVEEGRLISLQKRLEAELLRYITQQEEPVESLVAEALAAERHVAILEAKLEMVNAQGANEQLVKAKQALETAQSATENPSGTYSPVGEQYPRTSTGRRTALAGWIASPENPRTARVAANHIWMRHFGEPLVATPENFGLNGSRPTHPELLDWLAV
ncbi:MAG: DUF1549 domain-containing protein, partial [Planctomycetaceae bacterium]|nr:DUF1549 domain-containing protein [Planctomycetaceae bacterium]